MNLDPWPLALGAGAGAFLGLLYFGALWLTVVRIGRVRRPGRMWLASFALRLGLLLVAFYALLNRGWPVLAAAMFGFLAARQLWIWVKGGRKSGLRGKGGEPETRSL